MKNTILIIIAVILLAPSLTQAELTKDEKYFIIGRALSFAYNLDAISDICNDSSNSRNKFNSLKNLLKEKHGLDLYVFEDNINILYSLNLRDEVKIETRKYIDKIGGCGSSEYYEWLVRGQKEYSEALVVIAMM